MITPTPTRQIAAPMEVGTGRGGENEIKYVLREVLSRYELHEGARVGRLGPPYLVGRAGAGATRALGASAHPASAATVKHAKAPTVTSPGT
jgi:hypothetical protein